MEDFSRSLKEQSNMELEEMSEDRLNFKLSLRKKKFNEILIRKRIFSKPEDSPWTHELFLSNLKLPPDYKIIFGNEEEQISIALNSIKSENILKLKYGICLIKQYTTYFPENSKLNPNLNLSFISDLLNLLEKWGEKKEKQIIFNILYIMTNYSFINTNKTISKFFLSSKGYKIWDLCFDLQDYEIMSQLVWILDNITYDDTDSSYNLLKSNFFQKKIYNFYQSPAIFSHLNENNPQNLFSIIIERGIGLFSNLLATQYTSTFNKEEKYKLSIPIFELLLKYSESNSQEIFYSCVYSIDITIENEPRLIDLIDNSNILNYILDKKFFTDDRIVLYSNRILGEYIAKKSGLSQKFYERSTYFEMDILFGTKSSTVIIEVFWVLSNIMYDNESSSEIICYNKPFIDRAINIYKNWGNYKIIKDMSYFFLVLVELVNINTFIELENKGLIKISFEHAKNIFDDSSKVIIIFELIELFLKKGDLIKENYGGKNLIKEKYDNYGLRDLLKKYENSNNEQLDNIIEKIINKYY